MLHVIYLMGNLPTNPQFIFRSFCCGKSYFNKTKEDAEEVDLQLPAKDGQVHDRERRQRVRKRRVTFNPTIKKK